MAVICGQRLIHRPQTISFAMLMQIVEEQATRRRIDRLEERVDERFDRVDAEFGRIDARFQVIETDVRELRGDLKISTKELRGEIKSTAPRAAGSDRVHCSGA